MKLKKQYAKQQASAKKPVTTNNDGGGGKAHKADDRSNTKLNRSASREVFTKSSHTTVSILSKKKSSIECSPKKKKNKVCFKLVSKKTTSKHALQGTHPLEKNLPITDKKTVRKTKKKGKRRGDLVKKRGDKNPRRSISLLKHVLRKKAFGPTPSKSCSTNKNRRFKCNCCKRFIALLEERLNKVNKKDSGNYVALKNSLLQHWSPCKEGGGGGGAVDDGDKDDGDNRINGIKMKKKKKKMPGASARTNEFVEMQANFVAFAPLPSMGILDSIMPSAKPSKPAYTGPVKYTNGLSICKNIPPEQGPRVKRECTPEPPPEEICCPARTDLAKNRNDVYDNMVMPMPSSRVPSFIAMVKTAIRDLKCYNMTHKEGIAK